MTPGTLTVTAQSITPGADPADPDPAYQGVTVSDPSDTTYNGTSQEQPVEMLDKDGNPLTEGVDYTVTYSGDTTNAGTVKVTVEGKGNYSGTVTKTYTIDQREVTVTAGSASKSYDGTPLTSDEVTVSGEGFVKGDEPTYSLTGSQTDAGTSENGVTVKFGDGQAAKNYKVTVVPGTLTVTAQPINPADPSYPKDAQGNPAGVTSNDPVDVTYDGNEHKFVPVVKDKDGNVLVEGKDYKVTYSTNDFVNTGTITVTITGIGNYTGTVTKSYKIDPAPTPSVIAKTGDDTPSPAPVAAAGMSLLAMAALFFKRAFGRRED